jgi:cystathionine beta-lyase/cystathionine gamma-synthase
MSNLASATAAIESAAAANRGQGRLVVWLETPSNPQTKVTDVAAIAAVAHLHGAVVVVDSTWTTPWISTPLALGADIVMHSLTK